MRHGHSEANEQGIIVSRPEIGTRRYGLTEKGRAQVEASARAFDKNDVLQLLQTVFEQGSPSTHRQVRPIGVAEIRRFG